MNNRLEQLEKDTNAYLNRYDGQPVEKDMSINNISSSIPYAMYKEHGSCWLGKINLYPEDVKPFKLLQYKFPVPKETSLFNFSFDFCIPVHNTELEQMINDRATCTEPYSGKKDQERLQKIFDRIEELNGIHLIWV